jgi:tape measure domain-containing protein
MAGRGVTVDFNANIARFTSSVDKMSNDLAKFQSNAARTSKNIEKSFSSIAFGIKGAFGGIATALSVNELGQMADSFQNIQARLKLATRDANEFAEANENIKRISASSKTSLEATAALYTRISQSLLDVGGTQAQVAATTQAMALGLRLSGATAAESASTMLQFSQAIGSGVLRGEEFNAINEAAPRIMKALADSIGVPVGQLRKLAEEGKITRDILVNSLGSQLPTLIKEAETLPNTISTAFEAAKNELLLTVGAIDKITGASNAAANSIGLITKSLANLRIAAPTSGGIFSFFTASSGEEANAQKTIDSLQQKIQSLKKTREELTAPTLANKLNNTLLGTLLSGGISDIKTLDNQIFAIQTKIDYLKGLVKSATDVQDKAKSTAFTPLPAPVAAPDTKAIAAQVKAAQAAMEALRKEGAQLAASVDPIINRNQELAKYVELLNKGAISQDIFDRAATKSITTAQAALDATDQRLIAAKQAQEALDALTQEGENLKLAVDPFYKLNKEVERYSELLEKSVIDQRTFELAVEKSTGKSAEVVKEEVDKMTAVAIGFQTNVQNHLGNSLYQALSGDFQNIGQLWKQMLARMLADAMAANLSSAIFGANGKGGLLKGGLDILGSIFGGFGMGKSVGGLKLGSSNFGQFLWPTFATGGDFGGGMRLVGERGPELEVTGPSRIYNANQTKDILSGGKSGVSVNYAPVINVDSRADRNEVHAIVSNAVKRGNADLIDRLERGGRI